ncbi:D-alanine--D-alanine ligase [Jatrophihabitans endophyticus]|uniref:D-alanine--D-alanine ligase n=1 Tax=Jatrophihabitans endophyticus TaxID=1206085 RepID=A0A1M5D3V5_9ACTN|nr:D-alanine--D-alanine ligase family protein [Jatrophihabitans endophyticus]SHF61656.1 D-alanine--D-alanine ligase [Jatrophihabitans endophyticus]
MGSRIRVAVVYGGRSSEHGISVVSAGSVLAALDPERYDVVPVGITPAGKWVLTDASAETLAITGRTLPEVDKGTAVVLAQDPDAPRLVPLEAGAAVETLGSVDVVFPVLHGRFGEDGTIQGLLEMAGVPYVGPGVFASAAGMDKEFTKILLRAAGLDVGEFAVLRRGRPYSAVDLHHLGLPVFVKPARAGSSVGITRVDDWAALDDAVATAFGHDDKVLVEAAVSGREIECGVLEDDAGAPHASVPAEIRLRPGHDWYDFDAKYLDDACDFDIPARLADELTAEIRNAACRAFTALDCAGLARVDFFLAGERVVVNEVNTMPGFTPISLFPRVWAASGVDYPTLVDRLIAAALRRAA